MTKFKVDDLVAAIAQQDFVTVAVLKAVESAPKAFSDEKHIAMATASAMDGVLAALAWLAVISEQYPTQRDRRMLADEIRKGLLKFMKLAERDLEAGIDWGTDRRFADSDEPESCPTSDPKRAH